MFFFRESLPGPDGPIELGFTDASLDLHGERPGFAADLARLEQETGCTFARVGQVHGDDVVVVDTAPAPGPSDDVESADAIIATRRGFGVMVRVADCVPILVIDTEAGLLAAVHAGRSGTVLGVVPRTVERLRDLGATDLHAWIGPHVCGGCYEVPQEMQEQVAAAVPGTASQTMWGTPSVDLGAGVRGQLERAGVGVTEVEGCTRELEALHSYRRDQAGAGRFAAVVWQP